MEKIYDRIDWHNDREPALNETNLNLMSRALDGIDDRVVQIAGDVLEVVPQIQAYLARADELVEEMEGLAHNPPFIGENGDWYVWNPETEAYVDSGVDASITVAIADVTMLPPNATPYVTNTGTDTDPIFHLFIPRGLTGDTGNGISSITKTSTVGLVDTYTITFTDGTTTTFTVTNGRDGGGGGGGDMTKADYDPNDDVINAGGIPDYVDDAIGTKMNTDGSNSASNVTFNGTISQNSGVTRYKIDDTSVMGMGKSGLALDNGSLVASVKKIDVSVTGFPVGGSTAWTAKTQISVFQQDTAQVVPMGRAFSIGPFYKWNSVTLSTSQSVSVTFSDTSITSDCLISVYTDIFGVNPSNITVSSGSCTVTFPAYSSAVTMEVILEVFDPFVSQM